MANQANTSKQEHPKARRFALVSNDLPIDFVINTLNALLRPAAYTLQPGERRPVSRYATILHTEKGDTHVLIETVNPVRFTTVKNWFSPYGVIIEQITGARRGWCRMLRYLTHEVTSDKRMYPDADVHVSDGFAWLDDIEWLEAREYGAPALIDQVKSKILDGKMHHGEVRERYPELYLNPKYTRQWATWQKIADERHRELHESCGYDSHEGLHLCWVHKKKLRQGKVWELCKATPSQRYEAQIRKRGGLRRLVKNGLQ